MNCTMNLAAVFIAVGFGCQMPLFTNAAPSLRIPAASSLDKTTNVSTSDVNTIVNLLENMPQDPGMLPNEWLPGAPHQYGGPHRVKVTDSAEKRITVDNLVQLNNYNTPTLRQAFRAFCAVENAKIKIQNSDITLDHSWVLYIALRYIFNVPAGYMKFDSELKDYGGYINYDVVRSSDGHVVLPKRAEFLWPLAVGADGRPDVVDIPLIVESYGYFWQNEFDVFMKRFGRRPAAKVVATP